MENRMYIELTNPGVAGLLTGMEELHLIKVLTSPDVIKDRRSGRYRNPHWAEAIRQAYHVGDDKEVLIPDVFDDENLDWWTWEE